MSDALEGGPLIPARHATLDSNAQPWPVSTQPMQRIHYSSFRASPSVMGGCFRFATHAREVHRLPGDAL